MKPTVKRVLDLSLPLYHNCVWTPFLPLPEVTRTAHVGLEGYQMERVTIYTHTGTHIDAPAHLLKDGATLDTVAVERFQGAAVPVDLYHKGAREPITAQDFEPYESRIEPGDFVLLCTGWGTKAGPTREYVFQSPWLRVDAANYLIEKGIKGVGIDHPSISGMEEEEDLPTHQALLGAGVLILEGLALPRELLELPKWYLVALPLPLRGASGAPARVVAMELAERE
jgi:arylformamidase